MKYVKVNISLPEKLHDKIEILRKTRGIKRSTFIQELLRNEFYNLEKYPELKEEL